MQGRGRNHNLFSLRKRSLEGGTGRRWDYTDGHYNTVTQAVRGEREGIAFESPREKTKFRFYLLAIGEGWRESR